LGTSTNYNAPTNAQWSGTKGAVTRAARNGRPNHDEAGSIIRDYIAANGGANGFSSTGGNIGTQQAGQAVARNLGSFLNSVRSVGLRETLNLIRDQLSGKPMSEITTSLLDYLGGPASTIDQVDARNALSDLRNELFQGAQTIEDLERILNERSNDSMLSEFLTLFFGQYLYHQFCRVFYGRLLNRIGQTLTDTFLEGIRDYIKSTLRNHTVRRDIGGIDWIGTEGQQLAQDIFRETLEVFGG